MLTLVAVRFVIIGTKPFLQEGRFEFELVQFFSLYNAMEGPDAEFSGGLAAWVNYGMPPFS